MSQLRVFDEAHYQSLNESRGARVRELLSVVGEKRNLRTAVDVGCGLGYFSGLLQSLGLKVTGVDGRGENVEESQRRFADVSFRVCNAEAASLRELGQFDLVFCFGLLYHLENPFQTIRHLYDMTAKLLLVESVIFPGREPIMALVDEGPTEDQGLSHIAFYPTEACLVKMLYRAGFPSVCRFAKMPDHPYFHATANLRQARTMLAAFREPLACTLLESVAEPTTPIKPWDPTSAVAKPDMMTKLRRFAGKPLPEKVEAVKRLVKER